MLSRRSSGEAGEDGGELKCFMKKVKITVLRKEFYKDFAEAYLTEGEQSGRCKFGCKIGQITICTEA